MKKGAKQQREFAKKLVKLSIGEDGVPSQERVKAVLEALAAKPPSRHKNVLKLFLHYMKAELKKSQATVQHAGELSATALASIETELTKQYGRKITATAKANPELLGGLRIYVADDVIDDSVLGRLNALATQVN